MLLLLFAGLGGSVEPPAPQPPAQTADNYKGGGAGNADTRSEARKRIGWPQDPHASDSQAAAMMRIAIAIIASGALEEFD
jgi:hypothetical protein